MEKLPKVVIFCHYGKAIPDVKVSDAVDKFLDGPALSINVSTHLFIDEIRARIKEGQIMYNVDVKILVLDSLWNFTEKVIDVNGRSCVWVDTEEIAENIMIRLLV